ncbi:MAG TPA: EamA family transporter [Patescibacteria group bacterium]|nr:EamA family transporter [Patescibacteria group bacterium]
MGSQSRFPAKLIIGLAVAIALDTAVQLLWKTAVSGLPATATLWGTVLAALHQPLFIVVVALLLSQMVNWLKVLDHADLSFAQPITALSYISVTLLSVLLLGEKIGGLQILGIGFMLVGVWFISRTDHVTRPDEPDSP